jgi:uncharacterized spore protein YtfJ
MSTTLETTQQLELMIHEITETLRTEGNARAIFGEPMQLDQHRVVPVAAVTISIGGGFGRGERSGVLLQNAIEAALRLVPGGSAAGGGGGINVTVWPVGYLHEDQEHVVFTRISEPPAVRPGKH